MPMASLILRRMKPLDLLRTMGMCTSVQIVWFCCTQIDMCRFAFDDALEIDSDDDIVASKVYI